MEESNRDQILIKAGKYQSFLEKKKKMLPENSYILLNAEGSWSILLGKLKTDLKTLLKREAATRRRLTVMEMLDGGNRSRLRGFDLFRLYQILEQRLMLPGNKDTETQRMMTELLMESHFLLSDDVLSPAPLRSLYDKMMSEVEPEIVDSILTQLKSKYS